MCCSVEVIKFQSGMRLFQGDFHSRFVILVALLSCVLAVKTLQRLKERGSATKI